MSTTKYQCKNCTHKWTGNDSVQACPECHSAKIRKETSQSPWKYVVGTVLVLAGTVILVSFLWGRKGGTAGSTYVVHARQVEDYVQVELERYTEHEGQLKREFLNPSDFEACLEHLEFRGQSGGRISFMDGNRIYPCKDGDILLSWRNSAEYPLRNVTDTQKPVRFILPEKRPNPKANCGDTLQLTIISVKPSQAGTLIVITNLDDKAKVMVSLTGRSGPYLENHQFTIPTEPFKANVWAYVGGKDTTEVPPAAWKLNRDTIYPIKKENAKPDEKRKIEQDFLRLANAFGSAPDRDAAAPFNQFLARHAADPHVMVNGESLKEGVAELLIRLRIDFLNDGKRYRIKPGSLQVSEKGKITRFEFMEQENR